MKKKKPISSGRRDLSSELVGSIIDDMWPDYETGSSDPVDRGHQYWKALLGNLVNWHRQQRYCDGEPCTGVAYSPARGRFIVCTHHISLQPEQQRLVDTMAEMLRLWLVNYKEHGEPLPVITYENDYVDLVDLLEREPGRFKVYESSVDLSGPMGRFGLLAYPPLRQNLVHEIRACVRSICLVEGKAAPTDAAGLLALLRGREALPVVTHSWVTTNGFEIG